MSKRNPLVKDACPDLLKEWDYEKNKDVDADRITTGSNKAVWWKCLKYGHEWEAPVARRASTKTPSKCPFCANLKVLAGFNDLETRYPDVAKLWHPGLNGDLLPSQVMPGSEKKYYWLGECGHEWDASVYNTVKGKRCPYCAGRKVLIGFNDLYTTHPEISKKWDHEKNGDLTPSLITAGSNKKIWWKCDNGHSWERIVSKQIYQNCPFEVSYSSQINKLSQTHPELLKEWDYEKNKNYSPESLTATSKRTVWWKCSAKGHIQRKMIKNWVKSGCSLCVNGLAENYPYLRNEWVFEKNDELGFDFDQLLSRSTAKAWWKCSNNHEYRAVVHSRTRDNSSNCPYCANRTFLSGFNDLETLCPELMKEWDYEKNKEIGLDPSEMITSSIEHAWWKRLKKGHSWRTIVSARTSKDLSGCPFCSNRQIISGDNDFATLRKDLLDQWDFEKNSAINIFPDKIAPNTNMKIWWKCSIGHSYFISPNAKKPECHKCWNGFASKDEKKLAEFIEELIGVDKVVRSDRTVIPPRELDIYVPSLNVAFEYNGIYWHDKGLFLEDLKNNTYFSKERIKSRDCEILGINVVHIWEDDWLDDEDLVKDQVKSLLLKYF